MFYLGGGGFGGRGGGGGFGGRGGGKTKSVNQDHLFMNFVDACWFLINVKSNKVIQLPQAFKA